MKEHEWITEERETNFIGSWTINRCVNCGGISVDLFRRKTNRPRKIKLEGSDLYLPQDCDEAQKITQEYWQKQGNNKEKYKQFRELYKNEKKKYSR